MSSAMQNAESICAQRHLQFTRVRRRVLEILLSEHKALGAYDILSYLNFEGLGSQPPVAYRALEFLVLNGFVHKVEKLNAFIACSYSGKKHLPAFMICRLCKAVAESRTTPSANSLGDAAREAGFQIENTVVEAEGICRACQGLSK
ncbi:MAG: transcriptional repressor [Granulosicoccus sp.]